MLDDGRTLWEADAGLLQRHGLATEAPLAAAATPPQPEEQQHPDDEESESDEEPVRPARECARLLTTLACYICSLRNCMPLRAKRLCMRSADANSVAHRSCPPACRCTGVTQSRAERKQRRNFAAEAGETGGVYGEDMDEGTPPPGAKPSRPPMPPQTLEVSLLGSRSPPLRQLLLSICLQGCLHIVASRRLWRPAGARREGLAAVVMPPAMALLDAGMGNDCCFWPGALFDRF